MKIISVVWMAWTWKSVFIEHLNKLSIPSIYFWWFVLNEVKKRWLENTQDSEKLVREDLRSTHWNAAMAILAEDYIKKYELSWKEYISLDAIYSFSEYKHLKHIYKDNLITVAIHAPKYLRYERLSKREVRSLDKKWVDNRDYAEIENIEKWWPIAIADYHIINDWDIEEFKLRINNTLTLIREKL